MTTGQPTEDSYPDHPIDILLVEDNPADILLTRQGLRETSLPHTLHVVRDGVQAMAFLRHEPPYTDSPRPDLILLDLNMPIKDGFEVLDEVKTCQELKSIPVVVLTTSDDPQDINQAYLKYANSYHTKPVSFEQFVENVAKGISQYWFALVKLPGRD